MEDLSDDLMIEILIRLPLRAAHQCKAVSKHWLSLISKDHFKERYCRHRGDGKNNYSYILIGALIHHRGVKTDLKPYEERCITKFMPNEDVNNKVLGISLGFENLQCSLHGVLQVSKDLLLMNIDETGFEQKLMIYNALTEEKFILPPYPLQHDRKSVNLLSGFLCREDEYKVVVGSQPPVPLFEYHLYQPLDVSVFSSRSGKWTHYEVNSPFDQVLRSPIWGVRSHYAVDCNGKLHWVSKKIIIVHDPFKTPGRFDYIDFPDQLKLLKKNNLYWISNVRGYIRLYEATKPTYNSTISYWDRNDYANGVWSWSVNQQIDLTAINWPTTTQRLMIFGFNHFGDVVYLYLDNTRSFFALNLKTKSLAILTQFKTPGIMYRLKYFPLTPPCWPTTFLTAKN